MIHKSVNVNINVSVDNMASLRDALNELKKHELLVGVPEDDQRTDSSGSTERTGSNVNNATLAYIHNNGSPSQNIPARPTLVPGVLDAQEKISKRLGDGATAALEGRKDGVVANFDAAGLEAVTAVKKRIRSNTPPPLSAKTIAARRRRGVTRTNTLVDTGAFLNSHTYIVEEKGA